MNTMAETPTETQPLEVIAIASKVLTLISEHISCSDEVLIAALKIAATTIDETKGAHFGAQLRAGMLLQYRGKR